MKNIYKQIFIIVALTSCSLVAGPHKIQMQGDAIVKEGVEALYTLSVTNTGDKDYEDLMIRVTGFSPAGLSYISSKSDTLKIFENTYAEPGFVEAFVESLPKGETVMLVIKAKGTRLKKVGDVHSITLTIDVLPSNVRKGTIRKQVSIFKSD